MKELDINGFKELIIERSDYPIERCKEILDNETTAEKFNIPIISFIDTPGAYPGLEAEERGQGEAIARNLYEMMSLKVPIIVVIIGEGVR